MQDKAIAAIGEWQLQKNKDLEPVDLYIENMFPGKDYQMLLLVFEIENNEGVLNCEYKGIVDIEGVRADNDEYRKYAYRKGTSGRAGDVTITTKLSLKKLENIRDTQFKKIIKNDKFIEESQIFIMIQEKFKENYDAIKIKVKDFINGLSKNEKEALGISIKVILNGAEKYLYDFDIPKEIIKEEYYLSKIFQNKVESKTESNICSISGGKEKNIYGFAAPFKFSTIDKPGFISGFFNKQKNWKNYPVSEKEALKLELGKRYVRENLNSYFYGNEYIIVPQPLIKTETEKLKNILRLIRGAIIIKDTDKEKKKRSEERVLKLIAQEKNYFSVDILFFEENKTNKSIKIKLSLEEILPSRFRQLFIDVPETINKNKLFKNALTIKKELVDLKFSFQIIKNFFPTDFLDVVNKLFLGNKLSDKYVFEKIIKLIQKNYNQRQTSDGWVEPTMWSVKKAIMLISYLQELKIINYNKNYKYMETENKTKPESTFKLTGFNEFVKDNSNFLDSDIKVGIFAVGVLVKFLFDIQNASLGSTPFENKLRGYKLNPELLMNVYTEALDKIQKYQKNHYVYADLRDVVSQKFTIKSNELNKLTNNELSFYFVAGLELGKEFKNK